MPRRHSAVKHTPYQHKAPCNRKRTFGSEDEALKAIEDSFTDVELKAYRCPYCNKWHLSSSKPNR